MKALDSFVSGPFSCPPAVQLEMNKLLLFILTFNMTNNTGSPSQTKKSQSQPLLVQPNGSKPFS
jgi:hypothetical protein